MISLTRLSDVFVEVADTLVADFDVVDFLHNVSRHAAEITGSSAVGIMLSDETGGLRYMAASDEDARLLELFQLQHAEGPCVDCHRSSAEVVDTDLAAAGATWPTFAPRAVALGFGTVHAFPMRLRDQTIGALNVFRSGSSALSPDEVRVAKALTDVATIAIIQERAITRAEALTEQLQGALNSRIVIEQAKGAVARAFGIGVEEAFERLRSHARHDRVRLTDLARHMLEDTDAIATLRGAGDRPPPA
jgi:GAF domain-containing protein